MSVFSDAIFDDPMTQDDLPPEPWARRKAIVEETFLTLVGPALYRRGELDEARRWGGMAFREYAPEEAREWVDGKGLTGHLTVEDRKYNQLELSILARRKEAELKRRSILERAGGGFWLGAESLALSLATPFADPLTVATAFVPVVSQARYARLLARAGTSVLARAGTRAAVGAIEGTVGQALVEPFVYASKQAEQADYDLYDSLANIAFGGVFGGGLHAVGGGVIDYRTGRRAARVAAATDTLRARLAEIDAKADATPESIPQPIESAPHPVVERTAPANATPESIPQPIESAPHPVVERTVPAKWDRRTALRILHKERGVTFESAAIDRGGLHSPADPDSGSPAYDVALHGTYPEDFYGPSGLRYYSTGEDKMDIEAYSMLQRVKGRPNAQVTVYRAVEKDGPKKIAPGDWVTPIRAYAKEHGEGALNGDYKIIKQLVHARDIWTAGDSMLEWGYHPQKFLPEVRPPTAAAKAEHAAPEIREAALHGAFAQDAAGDAVNVEPIFELDPATRTKPLADTVRALDQPSEARPPEPIELVESAESKAIEQQITELGESLKALEAEMKIDAADLPAEVRAELDEMAALGQESEVYAEAARLLVACAMRGAA